ncbi:MAG: hypothetical protein IT270_06700 [Saprospiraceae bacterium]|nr:hypothetical protein [Saprospiraceae bacterium]
MNLSLVVLNQPFMKFPAGTVFQLEEPNEIPGWDPDERVREKQSFFDKRNFLLPDMGRGRSALLPLWMTNPCPEGIFDNADLSSGPCRITGVFSGKGAPPEPHGDFENLRENEVVLKDSKQGIDITLPQNREQCTGWQLHNMLTQKLVRESDDVPARPENVSFDFSDLMPGFYALSLRYNDGFNHLVRFYKSFPFLVQFEPDNNWKYTLFPTQY